MATETPYVFDNQKKAWEQLDQLVKQNVASGKTFNRAILLAQPQVGKTSFMIWGAIQRAKKAKELGLRFYNIIAISDSNNALRDQTKRDLAHALTCAGLIDDEYYFKVVHRASLEWLLWPDTDMLTVFTDEAHIAARLGGGRDTFQRRVYDDNAGNKLLVDVGATSFAHIALHSDQNSPYDVVINLEPGPAYNSVERMYRQGRIRQVEKMANVFGDPTPFLAERIDTLRRHGGYTLIRATGKRHTAVIRALHLLAPTMPIIEADMFRQAVAGQHVAIAEIPKVLSQRPDKPTVVLVRGALRVGIVLPPEASPNICEMIDTNAVRADTVTQSFVGRSCGYGKRNDTYSIFTNLKDIETVIDFYDDVNGAIPLGLKNTGAHRSGRYEVVDFEKAAQQIKGEHKQVSRCSLNNENDVADHVLRGVNTWDSRLVLIDKPNPNYQKSWQLLVAYMPEAINNYVAFNPDSNWYSGAAIHDNFIDLEYMADEAAE
jgi:hypothetical protein